MPISSPARTRVGPSTTVVVGDAPPRVADLARTPSGQRGRGPCKEREDECRVAGIRGAWLGVNPGARSNISKARAT